MKTKTLVLVAIAIAVAMFGFSSISSAADTTYYGASLAKSFDELAASGARQIEFSGSKFRLAPILAGMPYSASNVKCYAMYTEGNTLYVARRVSGKLLFLPYNGEPYAPYYDIVSFDGNSWTPDAFDYLGASGVSVAGKSFVFGIAPETIVTLDEFIKTFSGDWISFVTPTSSTDTTSNPDTVPILWIDDSTGLLPTTSTTATITAIIGENGGKAITSRGVCYGLTAEPNRDGNGTCVASNSNIGLDVFTTSLAGLASNTLYHARAYATNSIGTNYSQDVKFATKVATASDIAASLSVTINSVSPAPTRAVVRSTVIGGEDVIDRGVCYATTLNPTIATPLNPGVSGCFAEPTLTTTSTFNITLTGLNTQAAYYARAYATINGVDYVYSQNYGFSTSTPPSVVIAAHQAADAMVTGRVATNDAIAMISSTITSSSPVIAAGVCYSQALILGTPNNANLNIAVQNPKVAYPNTTDANAVVCTLDRVNLTAGTFTFSSRLPAGGLNGGLNFTVDGAYNYVTYVTTSAGTVYMGTDSANDATFTINP